MKSSVVTVSSVVTLWDLFSVYQVLRRLKNVSSFPIFSRSACSVIAPRS